MSQNHHSHFNSPYTSQLWAAEQQLLDYPQYPRYSYSLAYRPRIDTYGFPPPQAQYGVARTGHGARTSANVSCD